MEATYGWCARIDTFQYIGLIIMIILVLIVLILQSVAYAQFLNGKRTSAAGDISLNDNEAKTFRVYTIFSITLCVIFLFVVLLYFFGNYMKSRGNRYTL